MSQIMIYSFLGVGLAVLEQNFTEPPPSLHNRVIQLPLVSFQRMIRTPEDNFKQTVDGVASYAKS